MICKSHLALGLVATVTLAVPSVSFAEGKTDKARQAIAAAQAKIDASNIAGASGDAPRLHAQAVAALHVAQDELDHHAKDAAIRDANHAGEIADMAIAASQRERSGAQAAATAQAQQQAAEANARAAAAQEAAAAAQADAAAARAAPPVVVQTPAPQDKPAQTETTVTTTQTDQAASTPATTHHVVRHKAVRHTTAPHTHKTTTTVTTHTSN